MVFQNYALYPHLTVSDNIAFGLRLRKMPKDVIDERIAWAAKLLDLTPYLARKPKELSGGQRQRVAMGRAIVREPQVFLMDEPLSNLDAKLRVQMRAEIAKLQHDLGVTTIYVTHDQIEAMTMGDRVAVMSMGKLQQVDTPQHLYDEPANMFVAGFIGTPPMNLVEAVVSVGEGRRSTSASARRRSLPARPRARRYPRVRTCDGHKVVLGDPAEDLHPAGDRPEFPTFNARIDLVEALGSGRWRTSRSTPCRCARRRTSTMEAEVAGSGDGDSVVAARGRTSSLTTRRASRCGSATRCPSRSIPTTSTSSTWRRVRRFASGRRGSSSRSGPRLRRRPRAAGAGARDAAPPTGPALEQLSRPPALLVVRVAADLLRHAGPVRERRPVQRPRRHDRVAVGDGVRPGRHGLVPRRRPEGADRRLHRPRARPRSASRTSASPRSG